MNDFVYCLREVETMAGRRPIVRANDEGEKIWFNNDLLTMKATSAETDGAFLLFEELSQRGKLTPLHAHPHCDETFCILEGEVLMHLDGRQESVGPGAVASIPRGVPHALLVTSEVARMLTFVTPGLKELELFFRDVGEPASQGGLPPKAPLDIAKITTAASKHGSVVILGPPPFAAGEIAAA